ncbi:MAG: aminotransferase class V-fold PLP-dependent enzyme [Proteobacteria bacterium]|nr:aminotransferase class V-fold PLP-dependent enzyme [Pseudomonadota bacterium]
MSPAAPLYLDYAATTPADPAVVAAMLGCLGPAASFGNPSSAHLVGAAAAAHVATARAQVAALIGAGPQEIVFTSGATESNNLAITGAVRAAADRGTHIVTVRTEHKAVLDVCRHLERTGCSVTYLTPERSGWLRPEQLAAALRPDTVLVSVMCANNETGVVHDIAVLAALCRARGIAFHSDASQAAGRMPLDVECLGVDFLSFTAHKLYGPKGIGALYVRDGSRARIQPVSFGGPQERGLRPGTLPVHQIAGFGVACELVRQGLPTEAPRLKELSERLWAGLEPLGGVHLNGAAAPRVPGITNVSFEGVEGESLVAALPGLAVSTGAACNSEARDPSYVLRSLGRDARLAESSLRFSLGRFTTPAEVDVAVDAVSAAVRGLRERSPARAEPPEGLWEGGSAVVRGEAGSQPEGTWVRFHLLVEGDRVKDARFQAFACPHTLDTADWLCTRLRGRMRTELPPGAPADWAKARGVPVEKLGRLLVVEDAVRAALANWT